MTRWLHLVRHATTEDGRPGRPDRERRLTERGRAEARALGEHLRGGSWPLPLVWCSPAERARATAELLGLGVDVQVEPSLYRAGPEELLELVAGCDPELPGLLVVGHNPTVAELVARLGAGHPDHGLLGRGFPPAGWALLELDDGWTDVASARLAGLRLP
ncbi:histidine phosphatase family protein [Auraticoccus sp. F435]|uniref:Histidine phosphatase family protein n=1 Tax=Auraticoccus cholistanensis TaxID=2656650 RepID=A0A6A9UW79_9ACTN|nr:histidine phosphatase family protein [Auraticoccus cholistanensis]MVA76971.1 histidine phosphatase family protein [Auraticoccus cholistanensis]